MAGLPDPTKILIIRHAEKPSKPPNKHGPWDVLLNGQFGNGTSPIVPGWQTGALNALFAQYNSTPSDSEIATSDCIYAPIPSGQTQRSWQTVTPVAAWLNYAQGSPRFNAAFGVSGQEADLTKSGRFEKKDGGWRS